MKNPGSAPNRRGQAQPRARLCARGLIQSAAARAGLLPPFPPRGRCRIYRTRHTKGSCRNCHAEALSGRREVPRRERLQRRKSFALNAARRFGVCCTLPPLISRHAKRPDGCGACSGLFGARRYRQFRLSAAAASQAAQKSVSLRACRFWTRQTAAAARRADRAGAQQRRRFSARSQATLPRRARSRGACGRKFARNHPG